MLPARHFSHSLMHRLAEALKVPYVFASEFASNQERDKTLVFWFGKNYIGNVEHNLAGQVDCYPSGIHTLFSYEI